LHRGTLTGQRHSVFNLFLTHENTSFWNSEFKFQGSTARNLHENLRQKFDVFLTVHHSIDFFSSYQLNAHFLYSITIYMLHYNPPHISSSILLFFRRTNCIITASGIVTVCKRPYSTQVESGLQSALNRHTVRLFTESDDTRGCNNTIGPPEGEQGTARNILRIIM